MSETEALGERNRERRDSFEIHYSPETVKDRTLKLLDQKPLQRFTDVMNGLGKPNRTVYVSLKELETKGLVSVTEHRYSLTEEGRRFLEQRRAFKDFSRTFEGTPLSEVKSLIQIVTSLQEQQKLVGSMKERGRWVLIPEPTFQLLSKRSEEQKLSIWDLVERLLASEAGSQVAPKASREEVV